MISWKGKSLILGLIVANCTSVVISCVSRPGPIERRPPRRAFYLHQRVPPIHEFSQGASGKPKGPITEGSPEFYELVTNVNPDIVFDGKRQMSKVRLRFMLFFDSRYLHCII